MGAKISCDPPAVGHEDFTICYMYAHIHIITYSLYTHLWYAWLRYAILIHSSSTSIRCIHPPHLTGQKGNATHLAKPSRHDPSLDVLVCRHAYVHACMRLCKYVGMWACNLNLFNVFECELMQVNATSVCVGGRADVCGLHENISLGANALGTSLLAISLFSIIISISYIMCHIESCSDTRTKVERCEGCGVHA